MRFAEVQEGFYLHLLLKDKEKGISYKKGKVVGKGTPRFPEIPKNQTAQFYQQLAASPTERVIDITLEFDGQRQTFATFENKEAQADQNISLACSQEVIMAEVNAIQEGAKQIVDNIDYYKDLLNKCDEVKSQINPSFAQAKLKDEEMASMRKEMQELKQLLLQMSKTNETGSKEPEKVDKKNNNSKNQ